MALVACKECGKEVSKKAETCPNCGFKLKRTSLFTWIVTIFVGMPVLISVVIAAGQSGSSSEPKTHEQIVAEQQQALDFRREANARIIAEQSISTQLKAPATADFAGFSETQVAHLKNGGPNDWIVKGFVDAQNGFGAKIRSDYQVVIEFEANKHDSYRVTKAELLSR